MNKKLAGLTLVLGVVALSFVYTGEAQASTSWSIGISSGDWHHRGDRHGRSHHSVWRYHHPRHFDYGFHYSPTRVVKEYVVVPQPQVVYTHPVVVSQPYTPPVVEEKMQTEFTVNVPDTRGSGYVSVLIKRQGTGFVGPQGEYYAEFPKVPQLQAMYAK